MGNASKRVVTLPAAVGLDYSGDLLDECLSDV